MSDDVFLSVVIPVYQAQECLHELYVRLKNSLEKINPAFEIILVDDRSLDNSWKMIRELASQDKRVRGYRLSRNFGQHYAITAGIDQARGRWLVVMDCDLQDRPEEIAALYEKTKEGFDIVVARRIRRKDNYLRRFSSYLFYAFFNFLTDMKYDGSVGNFRIFSSQVASELKKMREELRFFVSMIAWLGFDLGYVDVEHASRYFGKSSYRFSKLLRLAFDAILASSDKILRLSVQFGFVLTVVSFVLGGYFLGKAVFLGIPVPGWASLIVSLYFLGGVIVALLGVLGVYLGKVFSQVKDRPLYVIHQRTDTHS